MPLTQVGLCCLQLSLTPFIPPIFADEICHVPFLELGCLVAAIIANPKRFARLYVGGKRVIILQVDEIATEPRARYYAVTDEVRLAFWDSRKALLGLCRTHVFSIAKQQMREVCLVGDRGSVIARDNR